MLPISHPSALVPSWPPAGDNPLYRGQQASQMAIETGWFPCYSKEYVQLQSGFSGFATSVYSKIYDVIDLSSQNIIGLYRVVAQVVYTIAAAVLLVGDFALGWALRPLWNLSYNLLFIHVHNTFNTVYPVNPVNGHRHFIGVPRSVEKAIGDYLFYPLVTLGYIEAYDMVPGTSETMTHRVSSIMSRLVAANGPILNPPGETPFDYRVKAMHSSDINAFATAGGGMVVFSELIKQLHASINEGKIQFANVRLADGSTVTVDLRGVTMDDALAALMGHEITHAASRHTFLALMGSFIRHIIFRIGSYIYIQSLKSQDKVYQELKSKPQLSLTVPQLLELQSKERYYDNLSSSLDWIEEKVSYLFQLYGSRKSEYEADATGVYFANQAGYNPLGAIYLQEFLSSLHGRSVFDSIHKNFEFLFTHPYSENRKLALLATISQVNPDALKGRLSHWHIAPTAYDVSRSSPGIQFHRYLAAVG